jgi:integrating conjugative element membrane protein (TIGR03747 family)
MAVVNQQRAPKKTSWLTRHILSWLCITFIGWVVLMGWSLVSWGKVGFGSTLEQLKQLTLKQSLAVRDFSESTITQKLNDYVRVHTSFHVTELVQKAQQVGAHVTQAAKVNVGRFLPDQNKELLPELTWAVNDMWRKVQMFELLLEATGQLLLIKLAIIGAAIPLFLLAIMAGLVDGLNQRAIRTASLGRESTYVFHKSIPLARKAVFLILGLWLAMPHSFSPSLLLVGLSVFLSFIVSVTSSRFKKYL